MTITFIILTAATLLFAKEIFSGYESDSFEMKSCEVDNYYFMENDILNDFKKNSNIESKVPP